MLAQYHAIEKFLTNTIRATHMSQADVTKMQTAQVEQLKSAFSRCRFDFTDAANLQAALAVPTIAFSDPQRQDIAAMVSRLSTADGGRSALCATDKAKLQDCPNFASMLTEQQWTEVETMPDIEAKLQVVVRIMLQLGLRNPNEATKKIVLIIVTLIDKQHMSINQFYKWLQKLTTMLTRMRKSPTYPAATMINFPVSGAMLKTMVPTLYPDGDPVPSRVSAIEIDQRSALYGSRSTQRALREEASQQSSHAWLATSNSAMQQPDMSTLMRLGQMIAQATQGNVNRLSPDVPMSYFASRSGVRERPASAIDLPRPANLPIMDREHAPDSLHIVPIDNVPSIGRADDGAEEGNDMAAHGTDGDDGSGLAAVRAELRAAMNEKAVGKKQKKAANAKAKAAAKAKAKAAAKAKPKPVAKAHAKAKAAPVPAKPTGKKLILGCSKCRYVTAGCSQCKDPSFTGKRGRL